MASLGRRGVLFVVYSETIRGSVMCHRYR